MAEVLVSGRHQAGWTATVTCKEAEATSSIVMGFPNPRNSTCCGAVIKVTHEDLFEVDGRCGYGGAYCLCPACGARVQVYGGDLGAPKLPDPKEWEATHPEEASAAAEARKRFLELTKRPPAGNTCR